MPSATVTARTRPSMRVRHQVALGLGSDLSEVGRARREVRECLVAWRQDEAADSVLLVLSELVGNALRHAPSSITELTVTTGSDEVLLEVRDGSRKPPAMNPHPDPYGETGRGLALVDVLARDWGWMPHADGTKTTWAVLPATAVTDFAPALLPVCRARRSLPERLVPAAQALAPAAAGEPEHVERDLRCVLQAHTAGAHHANVMHLDGRDTGSVWGRWDRDDGPPGLVVLPDCGAPAPDPLDEACCQYAGHPGGHCYQLTDPWHP
nr:ATP-binding protein [Streptomyces sp. NBC_00899]